MSAREEILARIRTALSDADRSPVTVPRDYRTPQRSGDVVSLFCERVADYRAVVVRCGEAEAEVRIAEALRTVERVVVPKDLGWHVPSAFVDEGAATEELDQVEAVVTGATVGIAETGTIVLTHGPGQGRRALSLIPDLHVCVVRAAQVVADVPDALGLLDPRDPQTWISGPSATSDIELNRVEGVHGPRSLHVLVVG